jgi:hypothetical protein
MLPEVRIHDTEQAATLAQLVGARAFAVGAHIFAPPRRLDLDTREGAGLMAHELTHVSQQTLLEHRDTVGTPSRAQGFATDQVGQSGVALHRKDLEPRDIRASRLDFASGDAAIGATEGEREAQAAEREARMASTGLHRGAPPLAPDPLELAEKVYRLMQEELWLDRERAALR